jgi:2-polyprenyl-3-methyl-5-hydroxy-6-metoxy-1,4-benzoquinol methylase
MQGQVREKAPQSCWCGNAVLSPFSQEYVRCDACETLVLARMPEQEIARAARCEAGLYGKDYWFSHQEEDLGHTNIELRARTDLPERCLYWLKTLLRYRHPPGSLLELGCAHGGFVGLARAAGFDATGVELSPSIANLARRFFEVPILVGPIEDQEIPRGSLDVLANFDVLEHLQDPVGTVRLCLALLKPDGVLMIQTPRYREGESYDSMMAAKDPFLRLLRPDEHLYLFSETSIRLLLGRLGVDFVEFEPAIFSHYDMFFLASRKPLVRQDGLPDSLDSGVRGRLLQAMLDLDASIQDLTRKHGEMDADRAARLEVIHAQGARLGELEAERNNLKAQFDSLSQSYAFAEADRTRRLEVIHEQGAHVGELEAEQNNLKAQLDSLRQSYAFAEADRAARLEVIQDQGRRLAQLQAEHKSLRGQLAEQQALAQNVVKRLGQSEARLTIVQNALQEIRHSRAYRLMRRLGRWRWVDEVLNASLNGVSPPDEDKTS